MREEQLREILTRHKQEHILRHWTGLTPEERSAFLTGCEGLDFDALFALYRRFAYPAGHHAAPLPLEPAEVIELPAGDAALKLWEEARSLGAAELAKNQLAVLIVSGGQGSRLGHPGPKGTFPITPLRHKSFFQLFAETIRALNRRYGVSIPLVIMTSSENDAVTRQFFADHDCFGLPPARLLFFIQRQLPSLTSEGELILKDRTHLFTNPDGHGGTLKAIHASGVLQKLKELGISHIFYGQVDNPLLKIADPGFLGFHLKARSEMSSKVVRRRSFDEKVGLYVKRGGKDAVIEYSDLHLEPKDFYDSEGRLRHWAGSIAIHILSVDFIERLNKYGFALPYHRAVKKMEAWEAPGKVVPLVGWKFETFVFDAVPLAERACCVETARDEEFAPVKNAEGEDSVGSARELVNQRNRRWFKASGVSVAPQAEIEISPEFALDAEELRLKLAGETLSITEDSYFE